MEKLLFNPNRFETPKNVILIPQFWGVNYLQKLKKEAQGCINLILSDLLFFPDYLVIVGFLGYPHILTILEFIENIREKEIYFLGTAGSLNKTIDHPMPLIVEEIYSTEILDHFSVEKSFPLKTVDSWNFRKARGVTVDIIQRETASWLNEQIKRGIDFVEMELFPLRVYLGKPFCAVVVASDLLEEPGIAIFTDKQTLQREFIRSYESIVKTITVKG